MIFRPFVNISKPLMFSLLIINLNLLKSKGIKVTHVYLDLNKLNQLYKWTCL